MTTDRIERERVRKLAARRGYRLSTAREFDKPYALFHDEYGVIGPFANLPDVIAELHARQDMASTTPQAIAA